MHDYTQTSQRGLFDCVLTICDDEFYYVIAMLALAPLAFGTGLLLGIMLSFI